MKDYFELIHVNNAKDVALKFKDKSLCVLTLIQLTISDDKSLHNKIHLKIKTNLESKKELCSIDDGGNFVTLNYTAKGKRYHVIFRYLDVVAHEGEQSAIVEIKATVISKVFFTIELVD